MKYDGNLSTSNAARQRLHVFYCSKERCELQWDRRLFNSRGDEVRRNAPGQHMRGLHKIRLPYKAMTCPVCSAPLRFPKEISVVGGVHYDPPLLRLWCEKHDVDHGPQRRRELQLPSGTRKGLTFYYSRKKSEFVEIFLKALKSGHPVRTCRAHRRIRITTIQQRARARVPKKVLDRIGPDFPVFRARCRFGDRECWISADGKRNFWRSPQRDPQVGRPRRLAPPRPSNVKMVEVQMGPHRQDRASIWREVRISAFEQKRAMESLAPGSFFICPACGATPSGPPRPAEFYRGKLRRSWRRDVSGELS